MVEPEKKMFKQASTPPLSAIPRRKKKIFKEMKAQYVTHLGETSGHQKQQGGRRETSLGGSWTNGATGVGYDTGGLLEEGHGMENGVGRHQD